MTHKKKLAVIGTGISGMASAYYLRDRFDVVFYEKEKRPGGHTHTVMIEEDGQPIPIDTGFMVYNEVTYPCLVKFFEELGVRTKPTSMSFSVQHVSSGLEYCGTGVSGLYAQRKNIFSPSYFKMLMQIDRFNKTCVEVLENPVYLEWTVEKYLLEKRFGQEMAQKYLLPMTAAIWSTPPDKMLQFPIVTLVRFIKNHGLLGLTTHYPWRTVDGGSRVYRDKVLSFFPGSVRLGRPAVKISRTPDSVTVRDSSGAEEKFDKVILAAHANEALSLLAEPTSMEQSLLSRFSYQKNLATLHTDTRVMPRTRRAWSSWNYRIEKDGAASVIYYMNSLQQVSKKKDYFVSINDPGRVSPDKVLWQAEYEHPLYDLEAVRAQKDLPRLNETGPVYFAGSYFRYGFHEDGLMSAIAAAEKIRGEKIA